MVLSWVLNHNPSAEFLVENLVFDDMSEDWAEVCSVLDVPDIVNSLMISRTKRNRAFWNNFGPIVVPYGGPSPDPNDCMGPGRTVQTYHAYDQPYMRPVGGSWIGDPLHPVADTSLPVLVDDVQCNAPHHIRPEEAEGLQGIRFGRTAAPGVLPVDRLRRIGAGWDVIVGIVVLAHCSIANLDCHVGSSAPPSSAALLQEAVAETFERLGLEQFAEVLVGMADADAVACTELLMQHYVHHVDGEYSILDSGPSKIYSTGECKCSILRTKRL